MGKERKYNKTVFKHVYNVYNFRRRIVDGTGDGKITWSIGMIDLQKTLYSVFVGQSSLIVDFRLIGKYMVNQDD